MTFFLLVSLPILLQHSLILWTAIIQPSDNFSTNMLLSSLKSPALNLVILGLPAQLSKSSAPSLLMPANVTITPAQSARNLGVIFDSTPSMSDHISPVSKSCYLSIRDIRRIRNTLNFSTGRTIATSLIQSKLDYCNSLFLNLPQSQLGRLQLILNSSARAVSKTPKFAHISPVLKSLHWLKIEQRIQYKVASLTYKVLQSEQPSHLHSLLNVQSNRTTRYSVIITLQRPSVCSRLKITDRSLCFLFVSSLKPTRHVGIIHTRFRRQMRLAAIIATPNHVNIYLFGFTIIR